MSLFSDIASLGGKLVSEVLTIDDLVAGQGVVGQSVSNLTQVGRWGAGSVLVSSNLAARMSQSPIPTPYADEKSRAPAVPTLTSGAG